MILGVGLGSSEREFQRLGLPTDPRERAGRLDEGLRLIDQLWAGESVTSAGGHYPVTDLAVAPLPLQRPRIPIWTAAGWPRRTPLRRAVKWDGVYLMTNNQATNERVSPAEVAQVDDFVGVERAPSARFDIAVNVSTLDDVDGGAAITAAMAAAGATWTMELTPRTFDCHMELVGRGPPRQI